MLTTKRKPASVGEILIEEFMAPMGLTPGALAQAMGVQRKHVNELCSDRRKAAAPTALILARVFGNSADFRLNVQRRNSPLLEPGCGDAASSKILRRIPQKKCSAPVKGSTRLRYRNASPLSSPPRQSRTAAQSDHGRLAGYGRDLLPLPQVCEKFREPLQRESSACPGEARPRARPEGGIRFADKDITPWKEHFP